MIVSSLGAPHGSLVSNLLGAGQQKGVFPICHKIIKMGYAIGFPLVGVASVSYTHLTNMEQQQSSYKEKERIDLHEPRRFKVIIFNDPVLPDAPPRVFCSDICPVVVPHCKNAGNL